MCVCVCVCVCMCFLVAWVQKGSQNKPDRSIVEAYSAHFWPGGHQRASENQQKNKNLHRIANTKIDNCKNVICQMHCAFIKKWTAERLQDYYCFLKKSDREVNFKKTLKNKRKLKLNTFSFPKTTFRNQ